MWKTSDAWSVKEKKILLFILRTAASKCSYFDHDNDIYKRSDIFQDWIFLKSLCMTHEKSFLITLCSLQLLLYSNETKKKYRLIIFWTYFYFFQTKPLIDHGLTNCNIAITKNYKFWHSLQKIFPFFSLFIVNSTASCFIIFQLNFQHSNRDDTERTKEPAKQSNEIWNSIFK